MAWTSEILAALVVLPVASYFILGKIRDGGRNPKGLPLPPGPPGLPLIGNAHQLLGKNMTSVIAEWAKEYGPVVYIKLFGKPVIILSSSEVVQDLLEHRHKNYSGRPRALLASKAMQGDMMFPFIHANERFRRVRKLVTTELRPANVTKYFNPIQTVEIHRLVNCMIQAPEQWLSFMTLCMGSMMCSATYDKPLKGGEQDDGIIQDVIRLNEELIAALDGGQNYVDFLPFLQYIPGMPYKARAAAYYELAERTYKTFMDEARANLEAGRPAKGIAARVLASQQEAELDYREQYWALASFYLAGSDTQSIASQSMLLAFALYPNVLAKAQEEVDRVVGPNRCPTYDDEPDLPYIRALVKEVLRWRPTAPTGLPHASVEDDEYKGYFIPGDSIVFANVWTIQMDPTIYENPEVFEPQRYIDNPNLPLHAWGFGGRVCPGRRVGEQTLFLEFATIAWALNINVAKDPATGKPIPLNPDRETGFTPVGLMRPLPFTVSITPRTPERAKLLARIVESEDLSG